MDYYVLKWLLSLTESSRRIMRWRLRLLEFDFQNQYRPGGVHQVPDTLPQLLRPHDAVVAQGTIDDEIPTFDAVKPHIAFLLDGQDPRHDLCAKSRSPFLSFGPAAGSGEIYHADATPAVLTRICPVERHFSAPRPAAGLGGSRNACNAIRWRVQ